MSTQAQIERHNRKAAKRANKQDRYNRLEVAAWIWYCYEYHLARGEQQAASKAFDVADRLTGNLSSTAFNLMCDDFVKVTGAKDSAQFSAHCAHWAKRYEAEYTSKVQ
jgi:hypothetical protein